ncbi:MAG TPA: FtsQ-type POTRA domain-containing protein [Nevskiaceae bacterium]|nr:FtsQ-type POTRA domain-containing protein [Nevskiaceae bacterium]
MNVAAMRLPGMDVNTAKLGPVLAGVAALLCVLIGGWWFGRVHDVRQVRNLEIVGPLKHVSPADIATVLQPHVDSGFLALDLDEARDSLEQLPWVSRARAERYWPAGVRVQVWEREAGARWNERQLLDVDAHAYTPAPSDLVGPLPTLRGPVGHEKEVLDAFQRYSKRVEGTPFELAGIALDARGEWSATTKGGIGLRLGRGSPDARFDVLVTTVSKSLADRLGQVDYVDLRYTNGFAVGWKAGAQQPAPGAAHG